VTSWYTPVTIVITGIIASCEENKTISQEKEVNSGHDCVAHKVKVIYVNPAPPETPDFGAFF
jgi:hypothetical protein